MPRSVAPNYIDVFAGAGGISLGLHNAGWKGLFAIEKSDQAFQTLHHNLIARKKHFQWPDWLPISTHDIYNVLDKYSEELRRLDGEVDLVAGGPPCQGFSTAGKRNYKDSRNKLVDKYLEFVSLVKPRIVFLENVKGFTIGLLKDEIREEAYSSYVKRQLESLGYKVKGNIIDFSEFGIPQKRKRFILVGMLDHDPEEHYFSHLKTYLKHFLNTKGLLNKVTIKEAISDLERTNGYYPSKERKSFNMGLYGALSGNYQKYMKGNETTPDSHRFANHKQRTIEKWSYILENCPRNLCVRKEIRDIFSLKKHSTTPLDPENPAPTLTTLPDDYIHYQEPRILTVREYARIQSFNDWYQFKSKYTTGGKERKTAVPRYTQVGNAVPPLFMELTGNVFKETLR